MKYTQELLDLFDSKEVQSRFWSKVDKGSEEECWKWTAGKTYGGYGLFKLSKVHRGAHVLSLWSHLNEAPGGRFCCHKCDNPSCVNPSHLWFGTRSENMKDAYAKGRLDETLAKLKVSKAKGEKNGCSSYTEKEVLEILRVKKETGEGPVGLHKIFPDVPVSTIQKFIYNQSWKHLPR